jgi:glycerophosphoryl diester phosphodiesterase
MAYSNNALPLVSAHRGGARDGFPENCIATFSNTIAHIPSIIEVDPRYTADSIIVLMHDATLERTSTGTGKVTDHTYNQLLQYRLKDPGGNITGYTIPTLDETIEWARNRTILILDRKDVPIEARVAKIAEHNAESFVMVMAYSFDEAIRCFQMNPDVMMEIMLPDTLQVKRFDETGVPWRNTVVFVSHNLVADTRIFEMIHSRGAKCIVGSSRNYDLAYKNGEIGSLYELNEKYRSMIEAGADIIEADLAIEAGSAIEAIK